MTMGVVVVASFAARTAGVPLVTITSMFKRSKSAARSANRSPRPSAERYSIMRFCSSMYPRSRKLWRNASKFAAFNAIDVVSSTPMRQTLPGCCARAAHGHVAAAPPPSRMRKSRRLIPGTRVLPSQSVRRSLSLPPTPWQVFGVDLNRSESYWLLESLRDSPFSDTTGYHGVTLLSGEPRNEIPDELRGAFRLISRREPLTHAVEHPPDAGILRTNLPIPVELFVVLALNNLERGHDQVVRDVVGCLRHATGLTTAWGWW